jgi:DNA-binding phage protein/AraC-like DNA-binding protein
MNEMQPPLEVRWIRNCWPKTLSDEHILPRSRLYDLAPYEIGTPWCESLTGYINRLGWTHHVPPRALVTQEIVPRLDERQRLVAPVGVFGTKWAMSLNGAGVATKPWIYVLSHLTGRADLPLLTLPSWVGDLSPRWQLRETPAWCPACFSNWRESGQPLYQPLHWMIRVVTLCSGHKTPLSSHCFHCQKPQLVFASSKTQPGECTSCGHWLGKDKKTLSNQEINDEHLAWQEWVWTILQELQATSSHSGMVPWESFFRHLATYLQEQKGHARLAQATGIDRTVLYRWVDPADTYSPTLETSLKFCYVCQVTPLQVMNGQLDQLQQTLQAGTALRSPLPHRKHQRVDRERCRIALQAALDGNNEPLALSQVAQRLGCEARQLAYHFPEECKLVIQRAKAYRQQRKAQRLAQVCEQVRQAVLSIHSQGFYPSHRRLRILLPGALMRLFEAKDAWRAALQELGYEL